MRVAFVSFEYPPSVAVGGIGAYAFEATRMLVDAGHDVVVLAAGQVASDAWESHCRVVRVLANDRAVFRKEIVPHLVRMHAVQPFDVLETPEIGAEALGVMDALPELPVVVKLHTPTFLISELTQEPYTLSARLRFTLGGLRRGRWATLKATPYNRTTDIEAEQAGRASLLAAPCTSIAEKISATWQIPSTAIHTFPLPYQPPATLTQLPPPKRVRTIGFLGRLEPRKGIIELTAAIPRILAMDPAVRFVMLGPSWPYQRTDMASWMRRQLGRYSESVQFAGAIAREGLAEALSGCDAMVLPSRWENFPFACWESLAAARVVIGSQAGGMADVIRPGQDGLLVPPYDTEAIVNAVQSLLSAPPAMVSAMARSGRERVSQLLAPDQVLHKHVACYQAAIDRASSRHQIG